MRLFMRSSGTVLVYYLRKASIVFSIALNLGSASLEMTQRAPGLGDAELIRQAQLRNREIIALRQTSKRLD